MPPTAQDGPTDKEISDLANALVRARSKTGEGRGRAVVLIGAGCSVSAKIPAAPGVAKHCVLKLARSYSNGTFGDDDADAALEWLIKKEKFKLSQAQSPKPDGSHWGTLYHYIFGSHYMAPNEQREVVNEVIDAAENHMNWAHLCLGELVCQRFVHTVLTTNFDQLVLQGIVRAGIWPVIADGLESVNRIVGSPKRPQVVHFHGSMHTYILRNSENAVAATDEDKGAVSMVHTLLQQSDLLVVVGYGGGEEGIMHLLRDAAESMPQLVIFWVTYDHGRDKLSDNAAALLKGENKFLIRGGAADKFFGDLMAELRLGQPEWVRNPIKALSDESQKLITPEGEDLEAIGVLVRAFKERVAHANSVKHRWPEEKEVKVLSAEKRARGEFQEARTDLERINLSRDPEAKRLHALNAHSLFERDGSRVMLDSAIKEFSELIDATDGLERFSNVMSMIEALFDQSDVEEDNSQAEAEALKRIISATDRWQQTYTVEHDVLQWAQLKLRSARAKQMLGESQDEDLALLKESEADYQAAIKGLTESDAAGVELTDAKAGLAAVLQVIGEKDESEAKLRSSLELFREVLDEARSNTGREEDAGPLFNLSGSLISLSSIVAREEAGLLLDEARSALETAIRIYDRQGEATQSASARERLDDVLKRQSDL